MSLPPPSNNLSRQIGLSSNGSPIAFSRSTSVLSDRSDPRNIDDALRAKLEVYNSFLLHEIEFVNNEIQALIERTPGTDPAHEEALLHLRDGLKIRFNKLQTKKVRVLSLLEVL